VIKPFNFNYKNISINQEQHTVKKFHIDNTNNSQNIIFTGVCNRQIPKNNECLKASFLTFKSATDSTDLTKIFSYREWDKEELEKIVSNYKNVTAGTLPDDWANKLAPAKRNEGIKDIIQAFSQAAKILEDTIDINHDMSKSNTGDLQKASEVIGKVLKKYQIIDEKENFSLKFLGNGLFGAAYSFEISDKKYVLKKFIDLKDPKLIFKYKQKKEDLEENFGHGCLSEINSASLLNKYEPIGQYAKFFFAGLDNRFIVTQFLDKNSVLTPKDVDIGYLNLISSDDTLENIIEIFDPVSQTDRYKIFDYGGLTKLLKSLNDTEETIRIKKCIVDTTRIDRANKWNELYSKYKDSKNSNIQLGLLASAHFILPPDKKNCLMKFYKYKEIKGFNLNEKRLFAELIKEFPEEERFNIFKSLIKEPDNLIKSLLIDKFNCLDPKDIWDAFNISNNNTDTSTKPLLIETFINLDPKDRLEGFKLLNEGANNLIKSLLARKISYLKNEERLESFKILNKDADDSVKLVLVQNFSDLKTDEDKWEAFKLIANNASKEFKKEHLSTLIDDLFYKYQPEARDICFKDK